MVLIDKTFAASASFRSFAFVPGRLLQVRIDHEPCIHIFALYQFVWHEPSVDPDCVKNREKVWTSLQSAIRGIPWRSQLLVAGDFNTP